MRKAPVLTGFLVAVLCGCDNSANIGRARLALKTLDKAMIAYQANKSALPDKLEELDVTSNALVDPWGRDYHYDPTQLHPETRQPLIWSDGPNPGHPGSKISNWEVNEKTNGP
jgi:hypothetical protein